MITTECIEYIVARLGVSSHENRVQGCGPNALALRRSAVVKRIDMYGNVVLSVENTAILIEQE